MRVGTRTAREIAIHKVWFSRGSPCHAHAGLKFETAEIVVFELGAQREPELRSQRNLILDETAEQLVSGFFRLDRKYAATLIGIGR
jgi:hypothetical protein